MTRKEAADIFRERLDVARTYFDVHGIEDYTQAMELAVEVLSQEPSTDVISRRAAIEAVRDYWITVINADDRPTIDGQALAHNKGLKKILSDLPPAPDLSAIRTWLGRWDETTEFSVGYLRGMFDTLEAKGGKL